MKAGNAALRDARVDTGARVGFSCSGQLPQVRYLKLDLGTRHPLMETQACPTPASLHTDAPSVWHVHDPRPNLKISSSGEA